MTNDAPDAAVSEMDDSSPRMPTAPVAGVPSDNVTMQELLARLNESGYAGQFDPLDAGHLRCSSCEKSVNVDDLDVTLARRLEGASDPDDMATVFAALCPVCRSGGTVVLGYGPNASELDGDLSRQLHGLDTLGATTNGDTTNGETQPAAGGTATG